MATALLGDGPHRQSKECGVRGCSPIYDLATELLAEILACLDSCSLSSAILAHPLFYATFQTFQQQILRETITRLIPPQLLPLAFATYEASSIDYSDRNLIRRLLHRLSLGQPLASSSSPSLLPWPLTRRAVAGMERVHRIITDFAADFVRQAIPRFSRIFDAPIPDTCALTLAEELRIYGAPGPKTCALTLPEELRILRAFYRFQLYCNIFGRKSMESARKSIREGDDWQQVMLRAKSDEDMQCELEWFFWPWPPWVNEQLACVFEYLDTKISPFFDEVASHDIEWGWRRVDWVEPAVVIPHRRFLVSNPLSPGLPSRHPLHQGHTPPDKFTALQWPLSSPSTQSVRRL